MFFFVFNMIFCGIYSNLSIACDYHIFILILFCFFFRSSKCLNAKCYFIYGLIFQLLIVYYKVYFCIGCARDSCILQQMFQLHYLVELPFLHVLVDDQEFQHKDPSVAKHENPLKVSISSTLLHISIITPSFMSIIDFRVNYIAFYHTPEPVIFIRIITCLTP